MKYLTQTQQVQAANSSNGNTGDKHLISENEVNKSHEKQRVQVSPNPVSHHLKFQLAFEEEVIIEIFDLDGNKVIWQHERPSCDFIIDVSELKREVVYPSGYDTYSDLQAADIRWLLNCLSENNHYDWLYLIINY